MFVYIFKRINMEKKQQHFIQPIPFNIDNSRILHILVLENVGQIRETRHFHSRLFKFLLRL